MTSITLGNDSRHGRRGHGSPAPCEARSRLRALAIGVVALHVVDDNFLQPNPGTSAGDHLVGGLVPLAVLVAAAALYGRAARRGARDDRAPRSASSASSPARRPIHYTLGVGPSGDDYTGLLVDSRPASRCSASAP